jgi:SAM-dependent methyltransferase
MKRCLSCDEAYSASSSSCPACGAHPDRLEGFPAYAPALAKEGGGFRPEYFADLAELEARHFWFRARNRLIIWALGKYCPGLSSFLEIGCGTGYVLSGIADAFPGIQIFGSEIFCAGLHIAAARQPKIAFMQMDARNIPFINEFDVIGAFDVLEHISQDEQVLGQIHQALTPGGVLLLTVPQHPWLWSSVDAYSFHVRRYAAKELSVKVRKASFGILHSTSFVFSLLPLMLLSRLAKRGSGKGVDGRAELKISPWLNQTFESILNWEIGMIRMGFKFPVGGSRLLVARKL